MTDSTPPKAPVPAPLKSTPNAVGSAIVSDNIAVNGVRVPDIRPWIALDVENEVHCDIDVMLKDLLHECRDSSGPDKAKLFNTCLKTVVPICNDTVVRKSLTKYTARCKENQSYAPFVKAANTSLLKLKGMKVPGVVACGGNDPDKAAEHSDILLHHNDKPMEQNHQGEIAVRKPDIVIVSENTAREALSEETKKISKEELFINTACDQPYGNFEWPDVLATMEFKRTPPTRALKPPPPSYKAEEYKRPEKEKDVYLKFRDDDEAEEAPVVEPPPRRSGRIASKEGSNKRTSSHLGNNNEGSSSKRLKANPATDDKSDPHPNIQTGVYAAEKFAAHIGLQRVVNCVVKNDMIYLWHIDRQRAIQCSGFNFIQDYARFVVLLLILQRLPYTAWGYNSTFEPEGKPLDNGWSPKVKVGDVDLQFEVGKRTTHYGLRGRATNVMPVKSEYLLKRLDKNSQNASNGLVAKLYWPENSRPKEHEILEKVTGIAAEQEKVNGHVPEMVWWHQFDETSTANIREGLGIPDAQNGSRVLYMIVFRELRPITELTGKEFLKAWWDAVQCHRILWEKGVYHRDVAPSNIMYYWTADGKVMVVLNDYDLSSITDDGPNGNERTGTVPFMSAALLTDEALEGKVKHLYQHDVESFIWVLTWVSLRYGNGGKLLGNPDTRPLEAWLKADAALCRKEKNDFLTWGRNKESLKPSPAYADIWEGVQCCLDVVANLQGNRSKPVLDIDVVFTTWLEGPLRGYL